MNPVEMNAAALAVRPVGVSAEVHSAIYTAIESRQLIEISSEGYKRIGEPHDYGIMNGEPTLLLYQTAGYSRSGGLPAWRQLLVTKISAVRQLDRTFRGGRPIKSGRHHQWEVLFNRVGQP